MSTMSIFSYHLTRTSVFGAISIFQQTKPKKIPGLIHGECMTVMTLGSPVFSTQRFLFKQVAWFAQWESEEALDQFLQNNKAGRIFAKGWHTRLLYLRQWGTIDSFQIPSKSQAEDNPNKPVVAVTIARMKLFHVPRFIRWGRPVEKLVRDHPGTTLSLASIRFPRTVSTFSVWKEQKEMVAMVHGKSSVPKPTRHADAMKERDRKDFHFQFTTLRFKSISEFGEWKGKHNIIPID